MDSVSIDRGTSVTHEHLLSVLNTETQIWTAERPLRLLDVGCGKGTLLGYMQTNLAKLHPSLQVEVYGIDVADHGVQIGDYFSETIQRLYSQNPDVLWTERLKLISVSDTWPYPDCFFDAIYSNQVLEHVGNHDLLFSEIHRTLCTGGVSVHLFPLEHILWECHLQLPWVQKIKSHDVMVSYIRLLSRLGLGKFRCHHRENGINLEDFSEQHADYMHYFTNYLKLSDVLALAKRHHLRASFRYTGEFYTRKIASLLRRPPQYAYRRKRSGLRDWVAISLCKYVTSITLFLEKKETYTNN